uniref:Uncharacterized protein n=1 Tax=Rhizophora mucronata TaxID=61149 RepID=A0A2P2PEG6_RHIMU
MKNLHNVVWMFTIYLIFRQTSSFELTRTRTSDGICSHFT